jgi:hydroxyacylglutathione hydrolase
MQLTEHIYIVGSGHLGFDLTDPYDCNVYLIDGGAELALIDGGSGMGVEKIQAQIGRHGFDLDRVRYLLLTHYHADHGGGAWRWKELMPWLTVVGSADTKSHLAESSGDGGIIMARAKRHGYYPADYMLHPAEVDRVVGDDEVVQVGTIGVTAVATPGHCDGHTCYRARIDSRGALFTGDMIYTGGRVSTQVVPDCRIELYMQSLEKFRDAGVEGFFPGHYDCSVNYGQRHFDRALSYVDRLAIPPSNVD